MMKYGEDTKKSKAELVECSYITESQYMANEFGREQYHKIEHLAQLFKEIEIDD